MESLPEDCIFTLLKLNFFMSKLIRLGSTTWKKVAKKSCLSKAELNLFGALLDMVNVYKDAVSTDEAGRAGATGAEPADNIENL